MIINVRPNCIIILTILDYQQYSKIANVITYCLMIPMPNQFLLLKKIGLSKNKAFYM